MRIIAGLLVAIVVSGSPASAQPPGVPRPQFRCEVPALPAPTSPETSVAMTIVSDGLICTFVNFGVPDERRNPATAGEITVPAEHGTAWFTPPTVRYIADRDYVGRDAFAYRATVPDAAGVPRTMTVRVDVDVRATPFDRAPGAGRPGMLIAVAPIRAGNDVPAPRKIKDVKPIYPADAQLARTQGLVVLDATIEPDGKVSTARVVRSIPLLDAAAIAAVRQWEFAPTAINGRAVPVILTVAVNFTLPSPPTSTEPAPATASPAGSDVQPIRLGPGLPTPQVLKRVSPSYTADALKAGISGTVLVDATVDPQGKVTDAKVVRSVPLLDSAALAAVRQWEFTPTVLNGKPVPVIVSVEPSFAASPSTSPPPSSPSGPAAAAPVAPAREPKIDSDLEAAFQLLGKRQNEEALRAFRKANDQRGQNCAVCYMGIARAYEMLGAAKNVVENCDRALAIERNDRTLIAQARQLKAVALQDLGPKDAKRLREAEEELRAALTLEPAANFLHFNLGLVLLRQGRDADGIAELKEELALRPSSPHAERTRKMIENPRRAREAFAPEFSLVTLQREYLDLASLKGKVVLLDFWGTWCPPCVAAVPTLRGLQKRHGKDAFVMVSVSSDSDEGVVRAFIEKNEMQWPQTWDRDRKIQQAFDVRGFPTYVLIDAEGVVQFRTMGGGAGAQTALEKAIKDQLKAAAKRSGNSG
jgi:TonB family protein